MTIEDVLAENERRKRELASEYDPTSGAGCCGPRVEEKASRLNGGRSWVPVSMTQDPEYKRLKSKTDYERLRCRHDFEYWAAKCVKVKDKLSGEDVAFVLNRPQRRVAGMLEEDRRAERPLRLIMLKARQWGGSTLVQMYMAWIQCCLRRGHNSLICAHVKDTSAGIRGMYTKMLGSYPADLWEGDAPASFKPFERSVNTREITGRGCRVTVGSAENQEAVRGFDYQMAHLSEVAFWGDTARRNPDGFVRAVCGAVALASLTLIAMESTANGTGNYFHREWVRCSEGRGDKRAVFVPWYEIDIYQVKVDDAEGLWVSLDEYERGLWERGCTLEMINWYHLKRREYADEGGMHAEYPTDATEAFVHSGANVFDNRKIELLRGGCEEPGIRGEIVAAGRRGREAMRETRIVEQAGGCLSVWREPRRGRMYVASVDIGGRSSGSDWSVIGVLDVTPGCVPEVVAQWRGHIDHDLLAWKGVSLAAHYNRALLVIESNTLECETADGDASSYILEQIVLEYPNLYYRHSLLEGRTVCRPGFHTNRATKGMVIAGLIAAVRDGEYVERDVLACDELSTYTQRENGSYGARAGSHDDILMSRAIGLYVAATEPMVSPDRLVMRCGATCGRRRSQSRGGSDASLW